MHARPARHGLQFAAAVDLPGIVAGYPPPSVTAAAAPPSIIDIRGVAAYTSSVEDQERQPSSTAAERPQVLDVDYAAEGRHHRTDDRGRRQHGSSTTSTLESTHRRRDVRQLETLAVAAGRSSRGRASPSYYAEISTSRTDVRVRCTTALSRVTDRSVLMSTGRKTPASIVSQATGRESAQRVRQSTSSSPQSQVASRLQLVTRHRWSFSTAAFACRWLAALCRSY